MPEKECPTRTVGPSCRASTRSADATASGRVFSGFCTEVTLSPAACNRAITSDQLDPSANSPCTRTTFRAFGADCAAAAVPWTRVLAAPAATMFTNVRRFIGYLGRRSSWLFMEVLLCVKLELATGTVALKGTFSLLDTVGSLLCAAQHKNGLSPTSQFSPSGGVANGPTCGAGMRA